MHMHTYLVVVHVSMEFPKRVKNQLAIITCNNDNLQHNTTSQKILDK